MERRCKDNNDLSPAGLNGLVDVTALTYATVTRCTALYGTTRRLEATTCLHTCMCVNTHADRGFLTEETHVSFRSVLNPFFTFLNLSKKNICGSCKRQAGGLAIYISSL